jgi:hypothetical protein
MEELNARLLKIKEQQQNMDKTINNPKDSKEAQQEKKNIASKHLKKANNTLQKTDPKNVTADQASNAYNGPTASEMLKQWTTPQTSVETEVDQFVDPNTPTFQDTA